VNSIQQYRGENTKIKSTSGHCNGAIPVLLAALHSELERLKTTVAQHGQRLDAVEGTVGTLQQQSSGLQQQLDEQRQRTDGLHEALAAARKVPQAWQSGSQAVSTSKSSA
jgi:chromosome segregation ATPase